MSTELFRKLTPDWVLRAVEAGGYEPTGHCLALNSLENRVYDLKLEDDSHVVAKFYRPGRWSKEAIIAEHEFLFELQAAEIPAVAPIRFADGESVHEVEGIYYAVWPRIGGRAPDELNDEQLEILGRLVARIHNVGATRDAPARRTLNGDTYAREPLQLLEDRGFLPPNWASRYRAAVERIADEYDRRAEGAPLIRIHGDCHLGNLLYGRAGWFFVDFDDHVIGPQVQDIWLMAGSLDAEGERQRNVLLDAYRQFRDLEPRWLGLIEPLRALRYIHYTAWIARRIEDPAFERVFSHFGTELYWQQQVADLEEQIRRIFSPPEMSM